MAYFGIGILILAAAAAVAAWYFFGFSRSCNPPLPRETITVGGVSFNVEMATTMAELACGLSGRTGLGDGQGMLFLFSSGSVQNFWMKDMQFGLDIIWISGGRVVGFAQDVPPPAPKTRLWRLAIYSSPPDVNRVLEVPAGTVARDGIQVGDVVAGPGI